MTEIKICDLCNEVKSKNEFPDQMSFKCFACMYKDGVRSKQFSCPVCGTNLVFKMEVQIKKIERIEDSPSYRADQEQNRTYSDSQQRIIYDAQIKAIHDSGLYKVFEQTIHEAMPDKIPKNIPKYLMDFLKGATTIAISSIQMNEIRKIIPGNNHIIVKYSNILGIIVNGYLRMFIPEEVVIGKKVKVGDTTTRVMSDNNGLTNWIKTKHGYVIGKGLMYQDLKNRTLGSFNNV